MSFDPNAAAAPGSGIFGLPSTVNDARVVVLPVPFDATTSYAKGTARGPAAIVEASRQVDLFDIETGRPYQQGIALVDYPAPIGRGIERLNREASRLTRPIIDAGGAATPRLKKTLARVDDLCERLNSFVYLNTATLLGLGKIVATLGGDHATPYGAIQAHSERFEGVGVLHIDAHADLREAYEGFTWSHASVMYNVVKRLPIARLIQVGIRDLCEEELDLVKSSRGRIISHFDAHLAAARHRGVAWQKLCHFIVRDLPHEVYVSFDIDGLDPSLCPNTGTPVPGGLSFHDASALLGEVVRSGRRIVGFDVNEVAPGPRGDWDANVGARLLYKLIGWALLSQHKQR
jgi:agmatinase